MMRALTAWVVFWIGDRLYDVGNWMLVKSEQIQGPSGRGPWDEGRYPQ